MKRALALLLSLLMALSLFPATAFAEETALPESPAVTTETPSSEPTVAETPTPEPEAAPTEALPSESPAAAALYLTLQDCEAIDSDGTGHSKAIVPAEETWRISAKAETNGTLSYRWQKLDQSSTAGDPYVDLDLGQVPSANDHTLVIPADASALGVEDYFRCVITAKLDGETKTAYSCFTLEQAKAEETPAPLETPLPERALDATTAGTSAYATSRADIVAAIAAGATEITCSGGYFAIDADLRIPSNVKLYIKTNDTTITVDSGVTLTNDGFIGIYSTGTLDVDGTLKNAGDIECWNAGTLNVDGSYQKSGTNAHVIWHDTSTLGVATVIGLSPSQIDYVFDDATGFDFYTGFENAAESYASKTVNLLESATITSADDISIPANTDVYMFADLTLESGATLTNNGTLYVQEGMTLYNGGTIENNGSILVYGAIKNEGTINGNACEYLADITTEEALRDAIEAGTTDITIKGSFSLTADLTIPDDVMFTIQGVTLTVPSGKTLTNDGMFFVEGAGRLTIKSAGTFSNNGYVRVGGGTLAVESGGIYEEGTFANLIQDVGMTSTVSGISASRIKIYTYATSESMIRTALNYSGRGYQGIDIDVMGNISLASNMTLASDVNMSIGYDGDGLKLTVPTGKTLFNNGYIAVQKGNTLQINSGATLMNASRIDVYGSLVNNGTIAGSGTIGYGDETVSTWAALRAAVEANRSNIFIYGDITLGADLTIGAGTTLQLEEDSGAILRIPDGKTLTINGDLFQSDGELIISGGGKLVVNGYMSVYGGSFTVDETGLLVNNGFISFSGSAVGSFSSDCYTAGDMASFDYNDADGATIDGMDKSFVSYSCSAGDVTELATALDIDASVYSSVSIMLTGDAKLEDDATIQENASVYLSDDVTLKIPSGITLTVSGTLEVGENATLIIEEGGTLVIEAGASFWVSGVFLNNGTLDLGGDYAVQITTEAQLRSAVADGANWLNITGSFSLTSNFTLPSNVYMSVQGATLTVPAGKTLQIDGKLTLAGGTLNVAASGKLTNNGEIVLCETAKLTVTSGGIYTQADIAELSFTYGQDTISGIPLSKINCDVQVYTESQLRSGLSLNGYRKLYVTLFSAVTLTSNLTVPKGVSLSLVNDSGVAKIEIPAGMTLTNNGYIALYAGSILDVQLGGTLNNTATGTLGLFGGQLIATGTVTYATDTQVMRLVYSEEELIAALAAKTTSIQVLADIELTEPITIPSTVELIMVDGKTLTVPEGIKLTVEATHVWLYDGGLSVAGTLALADGGEINIDGTGSLDIPGTITFGGERASILYTDTGVSYLNLAGDEDALAHTTVHIYVSDKESLIDALDVYAENDYHYCEVYLRDSIALTEDVTVPEAVQLWIDGGKTLTIPADITLTIDEGGTLRVEETGKIVVQGTLDILGSAMIALGSSSGSGEVNFPEEGSYYTTRVNSQAKMKAAIDTGKRPLLIWGGGFAITTSMTIPKDVHVWIDPDSSVSIGAGVTLTNNGVFGTHGKLTNAGTLINNNYFKVGTYGTFINNSTFNNQKLAEIYGAMVNNGTVITASGCRVRFFEGATKAGTNAGGSWFSIDGKLATGIEVAGPAYIGIGEDLAQTYVAQMLPTDAWPVEVTWTAESVETNATIDETTGVLTGIKAGDVTIRATSTDDSDIYGELTVHVIEYGIVITGADSMVAGKTLQLSGKFLPSNLTNSTIVWSVDPTDLAYASVSTSGLVLAKAITEPHEITVRATASDGTADAGEKKIMIYPALSAIQILDEEGNDVTNKTIVLNSSTVESRTFTCALIPFDAMSDVTWTLGITDAAEMAPSEEGDGVKITAVENKAKLITLTVKSNDGSGKSASIKIQVAPISNGLTVSGVKDDILYSGSKQQLAVAFDDPKPTNTAVKWTMSPEYDTYATLSSTGILTAKAVTQAVEIKVVAVPLDGGPESKPYIVTIKPLTNSILLKRGDVTVTGTTQTLDMGHESSLELTAITWPDGAGSDVEFTSSAPLIATVNETGEVTPLKNGLVTITAEATDGSGKSAFVRLNIVTLPQSIEADSPIYDVRGGANVVYRVKDSETGKTVAANLVRWSMDSKYSLYASLTTGGVLNAYSVSKPTPITLNAEIIGNEEIANTPVEIMIYPATQRITLTCDSFPITAPITFDTSTMPDGGGESVTLEVLTIPDSAMQDVTWTSSNPTVAKVEDGVVTPIWNTTTSAYNKGTAVITARTKDGTNLSATATVQVIALLRSFTLSTNPAVETLLSGSSVQIKSTPGSAGATNTKVNYSILSGAEFVTLSATGVLTAKTVYKEEKVEILGRAADGSCENTLKIAIAPRDTDPLVIQTADGATILNGTKLSYDVSAAAVSEKISANGFTSGNPVSVKWSVSNSSIARVEVSGGITRLRSLGTGTVTVTAKDSKGRTASFTAEFFKPATSLTIKPPKGMDVENLAVASGKTLQLSAAIAPTSGVSTSGVNWFIAADLDGTPVYLKETNFASISSSGLVTAKAGITEMKEFRVYAVTKNAPYLTKWVKVTINPAASGIDLFIGESLVNNATMAFDLSKKTLNLTTEIYPASANQTPVWTTSNKAIATVAADGTVTALKAGTVTITANADGKLVSLKLNILVRVSDIEIKSKTGFNMRAGSTLQLTASLLPTTASNKSVTWKLSPEDAQYATISSTGRISARPGTQQATIHVFLTSMDNKDVNDDEYITIYPATTKVVILDAEENDVTNKTLTLSLSEATEMALTALNLPSLESGALQSVTWKSSNSAVLKASADGTLTAVYNNATGYYNTGTVTITATAADGSGKSASVKVFVGYLVEELTFANDLTVQGGKTLTLKPTFDPVNVTNKTLKWVIIASDTPFATISSSGVLTAKKLTGEREITIYCYAQDGSKVMEEVTVTITT